MTVAGARQAFFEEARTEDARFLFTNPGTTGLPPLDEFADGAARLELILCLHEAVAVGAADGYAQATNRPALVNLHILPGFQGEYLLKTDGLSVGAKRLPGPRLRHI